MDPKTLELLKALQGPSRDGDTLGIVEDLLATQRADLMQADDLATLADISELLELWSDGAEPALAARALLLAAGLAEQELDQPERAAQLIGLALEHHTGNLAALDRLEGLLRTRGEHERLEATLSMQADNLAGVEGAEEIAAEVYRRLGELRLERSGDLDRAIEAYEAALDAAATVDVIRQLADLYALRVAPGDHLQAADLYSTLGDVVEGAESVQWLERALDLVPAHDEALSLLETRLPEAQHNTRLLSRWARFVEQSEEGAAVDARRFSLARGHASEGRYRDALLWIAPLAERGDVVGTQLKEAILENLSGEAEEDVARVSRPPQAQSARALEARSGQTMVGIQLPEAVTKTLTGLDASPEAQRAAEEAAAKRAAEAEAAAREAAAHAARLAAEEAAAAARKKAAEEEASARAAAEAEAARKAAEEETARQAAEEEAQWAAARRAAEEAAREEAEAQAAAAAEAAEAERVAAARRAAEEAAREEAEAQAAAAAEAAEAERVAAEADAVREAAEHARAEAEAASEAAAAAEAEAARAVLDAEAARAEAESEAAARASAEQDVARLLDEKEAAERAAAAAEEWAVARASAEVSAQREQVDRARAEAEAARRQAEQAQAQIEAVDAARLEAEAARARAEEELRISKAPTELLQASAATAAENPPPAKLPGGAALAPTMPSMEAVAPLDPGSLSPVSIPSPTPPADHEDDPELVALKGRGMPTLPPFLSDRRVQIGAGAGLLLLIGFMFLGGPSDPAPTPAAAAAALDDPETTVQARADAKPQKAAHKKTAPAKKAAPAKKTAAKKRKAAGRKSARVTAVASLLQQKGGKLPKAKAMAGLNKQLPALKRCYRQALNRKPKLSGRLVWAMTVRTTGRTSHVKKVRGTIKDRKLIQCGTAALRKARFAKPKKQVRLTVPFKFAR